jgi:hypothetical protein
MMVFLILAPYGAFATLMLVTSAAASLFSAGALCLLVVMLDAVRGRSIKVLSAASAAVFLALGGYLVLIDSSLSGSAVKLTVDAGMLAIALVSLAIRKPFTLQYAVEAVDSETAKLPDFLRANDVITSVWAAAFVLMMLANLMLIYLPGLPLWCGIVIAFAARYSALYFTRWYPERQRAKFTPSTTSAGRL